MNQLSHLLLGKALLESDRHQGNSVILNLLNLRPRNRMLFAACLFENHLPRRFVLNDPC